MSSGRRPRSAQEAPAGPSRRSARQQTAAQPEQAQGQLDTREQQNQEHPAAYHQIIDPALDGAMPPPPVPSSAKGLRGQTGPHIARRGTRRDARASSIASIHSVPATDVFSSQPEPQSIASQMGTPGPGRASSIISSGNPDTPARKAAKAKLMNVMLWRFFTASDELFTHLSTSPADAEMWEAEHAGFKKAFDTYRSYYVADPADPALDPTFIAETMGFERASPSWQKVIRIVSAANLASLLDDAKAFGQQHDPLPLLQEWDSTFATFFSYDDPDEAFATAMKNQVIELALSIRTLLSIFTLDRFQNDSPTPVQPLPQLMKIWCDGDMSVEEVQAAVDDPNKRDVLQLKPLAPSDFGAAAWARERSVTRFCSMWVELQKQAAASHLNINDLYTVYDRPEEFLDNVQAIVPKFFERIKSLLQQGSSDGRDSTAPFAPSDGTSRADSQIRSQLETDAMAHGFGGAQSGAHSVSLNVDSLRMMKQLEQQTHPMYGDGHQLPANSYPPAPRIPYPPGFTSPPPSMSYTDPTHQGEFQLNGSIYAASAAQVTGRKRRAQGQPTVGGEGAEASATPKAKKPRVRRKKNAPVPEAPMGPSSAAPPASAPQPPPAPLSQYPPLPGTQDEPDFDALRERTKEISAAARKVKEPQVRSAWVRNDVALLVKAVNTYQCKWSTIEKEIKAGTIPFERPRDQQALRDKARLLKQDFLKADAVLPRGFDLVVLGKKEREAVKSVGKNPDRKEADVDEHGRPINTEYAPDMMTAPAPLPASLPAPLPPAEPQPQPEQQLPPQQLPPQQLPPQQPALEQPQPEPQPPVPEVLAA